MTNSFIDDLRDIPGLNDLTRKPRDRGLVTAEEASEMTMEGDVGHDEPKAERPTYPCESCGGTGRYRGVRLHQPESRCFACNGRGFFYSSYKDRMDKRTKAKANKEAKAKAAAEVALEAFKVNFPEEHAWTVAAMGRGFGFATAMWNAVSKWGSLTDNQMAAIRRFMEADKVRAEERAAREAATAAAAEKANATLTTEAVDKLKASLVQAGAKGLKHPALRFEGFTVTLAGANSKNAGGLYLKDGSTYLGKIVDGRLTASWEAKAVEGLLDRIAEAMVDPVAAARAYGKRTGNCSCCGRPLTDPVSVERGIGPICESKYF